MTTIQKPYNIDISPNLSGLTVAGRNAPATRFTLTNNDSRDCPEVRINVLRADLMPSATMSEATIVKDAAGEKVITEKWIQAKISTNTVYTPIDDWDIPLLFTLDAAEVVSFDVRLVIPDTISVQGKISFSLLVSFKANVEPKVTSILIDAFDNILLEGDTVTLTATVTGEIGADLSYTWVSSNDDRFTVNSGGLLTGLTIGRAIVTALSNSNSNSYNGMFMNILPKITAPVPDGLIAWYDASDTSTITASSNDVSQWDDKSGNNYHATTTSVTDLPQINTHALNTKNIVTFKGQHLDLPDAVVPANTNYTICAIWTQNGTKQSLFNFGVSGDDAVVGLFANNSYAKLTHFWYNNDLIYTDPLTEVMNTLISYDRAGATTRVLTMNGNSVTDAPGTNVVQATDAYLGGGYYDFEDNHIAEFIIYHRILTPSEQMQITEYLNNKWGLPTAVPYETPPAAGMEIWLDGADTSTITEVGGIVSQWDDKSGNDRHALSELVVSSPSTGLETLNGNNVISFDDSLMEMPTIITPTGASAYTIVAVWHPKNEGNYDTLMAIGANYNYGNVWLHNYPAGIQHSWYNDSLTTAIADANPLTTILSWNGTTRTSRYNGAEQSDTPGYKGTGIANATLGALKGSSFYSLHGYIAEFIVYHRALTVSEITAMETYLNTKWGL